MTYPRNDLITAPITSQFTSLLPSRSRPLTLPHLTDPLTAPLTSHHLTSPHLTSPPLSFLYYSDKISYEPPAIKARDRIAQTLGGNTTSRSHSHSRSGQHSSSLSTAASSSSSHRHKKPKLTPAALSLAQKLSTSRGGLSIPGGPNSTPFGGSMSLSDSYRIPDRHSKSKSNTHSSTHGHGLTGSLMRTKSSKTPLTTTTGQQGSSVSNEKGSSHPSVNTDDLLRNF